MKRALAILFLVTFLTSCDQLNKALNTTNEVLTEMEKANGITQSEATQGLKEALAKGVSYGTGLLSVKDGFFKSATYKILFPPEALKVEENLRKFGFSGTADRMVEAFNRGAEDATGHAKEIFLSAINQMTIQDAINVVTGGEGAGTAYLKRTTTDQLREKFKPEIQKSLDKVQVLTLWEDVMTTYNKLPIAKEQINPDLNEYVLGKTMDALFQTIEIEENKIRANPMERTSDILKKVFEYADKNR